MKKYIILIAALVVIQMNTGCKKMLDEDVYSELGADNFLTNKDGLDKVLLASYSETAHMNDYVENDRLAIQEMCTDIMWQQGGGEATNAILVYQFTWDSGLSYLGELFNAPYRAIRDANSVLDNIDAAVLKDSDRKLLRAESRFLRAVNYYYLWDLFGGVPLRTSTKDAPALAKVDAATIQKFIEDELLAVLPDLPASGTEAAYGRAHKGAAMGFLCRLYLNTKQWQKCSAMADQLIGLNYFSLFSSYVNMFTVASERNKEMIWVRPANAQSAATGNRRIAVSTPADFKMDPKSGITWQTNWANYASDYLMYDAYYNTFEPGDVRTNLIMTSFINNAGNTVQLYGSNRSMVWKYRPDPNANGQDHGNDLAVIRYADILLSKAEALNELNGPSQSAIDLINLVRRRAGISDLQLANFTSAGSLRAAILTERGHEFFNEELRRRDLIRHGKLIDLAKARGVTNAATFRELYPIPLGAMNSNSLLKQNPGY
ncbi:MAG: RagB/SusD family nutrient uptake outer membrane protein [Bacteroidetes bacterium]|nr:RagB/SusD family nutrient uptake outer membrane protein [Bacteroidota bacterium]